MPQTRARSRLSVRLTLTDRELGGTFREVSGLDSESEVTELRSLEDRGGQRTHKSAGAAKWSNITLRRGIDQNLELWEWRDQVIQEGSDSARTDGFIELIDDRGSPVATYRFENAWPARYAVAFGATPNDPATETIELCVDRVERVERV